MWVSWRIIEPALAQPGDARQQLHSFPDFRHDESARNTAGAF
jgi:hypothetical protein